MVLKQFGTSCKFSSKITPPYTDQGLKPLFNSFPLARLQPGLVRKLGQHGSQLMTKSADDTPAHYTLVHVVAEPEQLVVSVTLTTERAGSFRSTAGAEMPASHGGGQEEPLKIVILRSER